MSEPLEPSVVYRTGPLTDRDYDEAIEYLQEAKRLGITGCPCGDSGHSAEQCHHNPLVQARRGASKETEFKCYHCGFIFGEDDARAHFGNSESEIASCLQGTAQQMAVEAAKAMREELAKRIEYHQFRYDGKINPRQEAVNTICNAPLPAPQQKFLDSQIAEARAEAYRRCLPRELGRQ